MIEAIHPLPLPTNEPVRSYAPNTPERAPLEQALDKLAAETIELPLVIDGAHVRTTPSIDVRSPHAHRRVLGRAHSAGADEVARAIDAAKSAHPAWSRTPWQARVAIFLRAAELLATKYRPTLNAATMLGQSKTAHQAEIDAACELIDFLRFNAHYATKLYTEQPLSPAGQWNLLDHRPLEGFVFAITPFNFTAIAGNLPSAPALMGNTVLWKPAETQAFSAHFLMELFLEAGLPPGVINLVYGDGAAIGAQALAHPDLAGVHFTGSTAVFNRIWSTIGANIDRYRTYPRIVGETGGKDFILAHPSADVDALAVALVRGAFEFQGQKCSAASRMYVPKSLWPALRERVAGMIREITIGDVRDFSNFMGAVIDARAFAKHKSYIDYAAQYAGEYTLVAGGTVDDSTGYFVSPTLYETSNPKGKLMSEEIFGPIATLFAYDDSAKGAWDEALALVDSTSPYALTGAVFANDRRAIESASSALRFAAGNFYVNDKPTGAVVGQQPFGGSRGSGTNDKAGSGLNLLRWVSPRAIKENLAPPTGDFRYPFMANPRS
ncbi:MAG: L-glutamate gamma-semialdehyde dehydrogenase [Myxococcales bacterium]|nr:L-glutamate gamma-semialdehyde dehydrogenase [Myxococcales bacterium]